jgi:hypothetical protein
MPASFYRISLMDNIEIMHASMFRSIPKQLCMMHRRSSFDEQRQTEMQFNIYEVPL